MEVKNLFAEADFRNHVKRVGLLDLLTEPSLVGQVEQEASAKGLSDLIAVYAIDPQSSVDELPPDLSGDLSRPIWVFSPTSEETLVRRLRARLQRAVWGVYADVYGVASTGPLALPALSDRGEIDAYAIICTPRSGSSFLCELLSSNGAGLPKEHLRPPVIDMLRSAPSEIRLSNFLDTIVRHGQKNGVFGTKVIWHFARAAAEHVDLSFIEEAAGTFKSFRVIYLHRKDKLLQALSNERAQQTRIYHVRDDNIYSKMKKSNFDYDYDNIHDQVCRIKRYEYELSNFLKTLRYDILTVNYENLCGDAHSEISRILNFLNLPINVVELDTRIRKIGSSEMDKLARRFCDDFERKSGSELQRIEESVFSAM
jgi:LPS sulfotransferase NodH